jgi:hypothetical protein
VYENFPIVPRRPERTFFRIAQKAQKAARATASASRVMDFSGEKSWSVKMHGRRLAVRGLEQAAAALLVLLLVPKVRVPDAGCTAVI